MPRQLPPFPAYDPNRRLNQVVDDLTATADHSTLSKNAKIRQSQLHQHRVSKLRLKAGILTSVRHPLGAIPSNASFVPVEGGGTVQIVRMTTDRVYVKASADVRVNVLIQR